MCVWPDTKSVAAGGARNDLHKHQFTGNWPLYPMGEGPGQCASNGHESRLHRGMLDRMARTTSKDRCPPAPRRKGGRSAHGTSTAPAFPPTYLKRLCDGGPLEQIDRGLYRLADAPVSQQSTLAEVGKRVPH